MRLTSRLGGKVAKGGEGKRKRLLQASGRVPLRGTDGFTQRGDLKCNGEKTQAEGTMEEKERKKKGDLGESRTRPVKGRSVISSSKEKGEKHPEKKMKT